MVGVVGEAGVGKSRLCLEFVEGCRAKGIAVYEAHCPAHGKAVSFLPLLELLRAYFGIAERDSATEARRKIAGTLVLLRGEALRELLPLVFDFVGVPDPEQPISRMEPEVRQQRLFAFVRQLFEARGSGPPSVTLVDDLQWIDPGSDAFLAQVAEVVNAGRTLLLLNFRPEYQASWMRKSYYQQLPLAPLAAQAMGELLADLMGRDVSLSVCWPSASRSAPAATPSSRRSWCSRWPRWEFSREAAAPTGSPGRWTSWSCPPRCRRCCPHASTGWPSARSGCSRRRR